MLFTHGRVLVNTVHHTALFPTLFLSTLLCTQMCSLCSISLLSIVKDVLVIILFTCGRMFVKILAHLMVLKINYYS